MDELLDSIRKKTSSLGTLFSRVNNYDCIEVPKDILLEVSSLMKDEFGFDQLVDIVGVDKFTKSDRFECIYNLWSTSRKLRIMLRVKLDSKKPEVLSVTSIWPSSDWAEREAYDMYGIIFLNHPDLRRIYMMEEFKYFPLRKDFPLMGIPGSIELPKK